MAEELKRAFSNVAAVTNHTENIQHSLIEVSEVKELPVILMLLEVTANAGQNIGTLIDLASDKCHSQGCQQIKSEKREKHYICPWSWKESTKKKAQKQIQKDTF